MECFTQGFPLRGSIKDTGILCSCSSCIGVRVVPPCQFEIYAFKSYRRASQYICFENEKSLLDVVKECRKSSVKTLEETIYKFIGPMPVKESVICMNCQGPFLATGLEVEPVCDSCMIIENSEVDAECTKSRPLEPFLGLRISDNGEVHNTPKNKSRRGRKRRKHLELASNTKSPQRSLLQISTRRGQQKIMKILNGLPVVFTEPLQNSCVCSRMYSILLYFPPKIFSGKRSCFFSPFTSLSTLCCTAQDAYSSSDDNVVLDLSYTELQQRMQKHATTGCIINALNTLNFTRHGKPTVFDYNWMFYRYFKSGSVVLDELFEVYIGMKRFGPTPNLLTIQYLFERVYFSWKFKDAILIVEDMINCGFLPSFTVITKLLRRLLKVGNVVDSAIVFEIMLSVNYIPSYHNVSTLIRGLCKAGIPQKAYFFFLVILEKEYFPCGCLFDHILWALCKSEQSHLTLAFFGWLKKKGIAQTVRSYTALVYSFSKERLWTEAFNCLNEMENDDYKPHLIAYTIVIKYLCDDGKVNEALKYTGKMKKEGCVPDLVTYNIVLRELCHQDRVVEVGELIHIIDQKGFFQDLFIYSVLVGGILKSDKVEIANKLLVDTVLRSCSIDNVIYNIYLHSTCCHVNSMETLSLMESMIDKGFKPTSVSYNTILKGLCKENNVDEALEYWTVPSGLPVDRI